MFFRFFWVVLLAAAFPSTFGTRVSIRIVDEASSYNFGNDLIQPEIRIVPPLYPRKPPSNFSGPDHLRQLIGKCFDIISGPYRYFFCPFHNVTQVELATEREPYRGILGVWQEWEIVNGSFNSLIFRDGDLCSKLHREVKVSMVCKETNSILSVKEPFQCKYALKFGTPLVCHPQSMLVFPRLSASSQTQWEELLTQLSQRDITEKGYNIGLRALFVDAGYQLPEPLPAVPPPSLNQVIKDDLIAFSSFHQCKSEYEKLQKEVESLRILVALKDVGEKSHLP